MRACLIACTDQADDLGIFARKIFRANRIDRADRIFLQNAILQNGNQFACGGRKEKDQPDPALIFSRGYFDAPSRTIDLRKGDHIRRHADGRHLPAWNGAIKRLELMGGGNIRANRSRGRVEQIRAAAIDGAARTQIRISLFQTGDDR